MPRGMYMYGYDCVYHDDKHALYDKGGVYAKGGT